MTGRMTGALIALVLAFGVAPNARPPAAGPVSGENVQRHHYAINARVRPLLLFWISRIWVKTHRGEMHDDPVVFAARDKVSLAVGILCVACAAVGTLA